MLTNMISYTSLNLFLIQIQIQVHIYLQKCSFIKIRYILLFRILNCKPSLGLLSKIPNAQLYIYIYQYNTHGVKLAKHIYINYFKDLFKCVFFDLSPREISWILSPDTIKKKKTLSKQHAWMGNTFGYLRA